MTPRAISRTACVILVLGLAISARLAAQAPTSTVSGTIIYRDGKPAVNVFVSIGGRFQYTDIGGRYLITEVPRGKQRMLIKRGNAVLWQGDVNINAARMSLDRRLQ